MGQDNYPTDIQGAVHMLTLWKGNRKDNNNTSIPGNGQGNRNRANGCNRMQFAQTGQPVAGCSGPLHADITCFLCNHPGHYTHD